MVAQCGILGFVRSWTSVILAALFQLRIFCDRICGYQSLTPLTTAPQKIHVGLFFLYQS